jgi:hypothetical protein
MNPLYPSPTGTGNFYSDLERPVTPAAPNQMAATLEPVKMAVALQWDAAQTHGTVTIDPASVGVKKAATGAYLVIATDPANHPAPNRAGQLIGRVFQLGNPIDEAAGKWELSPAGDMIRSNPDNANPQVAGDDPNCALTDNVQAYLIGRGYVDPSDGTKGFAGPAQDIAVYTGFIAIPPRPTN